MFHTQFTVGQEKTNRHETGRSSWWRLSDQAIATHTRSSTTQPYARYAISFQKCFFFSPKKFVGERKIVKVILFLYFRDFAHVNGIHDECVCVSATWPLFIFSFPFFVSFFLSPSPTSTHTRGYFIAEPLPNAEWNTSLIGWNECRFVQGSPCRRSFSSQSLPRVNRSIKYNATFRPQSSMKRGLKSHHRQSRFIWIGANHPTHCLPPPPTWNVHPKVLGMEKHKSKPNLRPPLP